MVHRAVIARVPQPPSSSLPFLSQEEPALGSVTRPGVSIVGPVIWEDPLGPVLIGIQGHEPQGCLGLFLSGRLV